MRCNFEWDCTTRAGKFFADELLIYTDDDPLKLNYLIRAVDELEFDKSVIINKYQNFMEIKGKN
ncbi:hypothetical protein CHD54_08730 [Salmonella enterica]|nr:hypothetical protein CHD54_08730 [Salmonella enterica]